MLRSSVPPEMLYFARGPTGSHRGALGIANKHGEIDGIRGRRWKKIEKNGIDYDCDYESGCVLVLSCSIHSPFSLLRIGTSSQSSGTLLRLAGIPGLVGLNGLHLRWGGAFQQESASGKQLLMNNGSHHGRGSLPHFHTIIMSIQDGYAFLRIN